MCPRNGELIGEAGDLLIFPPGSIVTLENRPMPNARYQAEGVYFTHDLTNAVIDAGLPPPIRRHRLLEPLIWLQHHGVRFSAQHEDQPFARVRVLIEADLGRPWRASEAASHLAMSEATFRRWLAKSGQSFSAILHATRLENGLGLLQTTDFPVSQIALDCGFRTPSHFSDSFRKRFGISPRAIRAVDDD